MDQVSIFMICLIGVCLTVGLFSMWLMPLLEDRLGEPWIIKGRTGFLHTGPGGQWGWVTKARYADEFDKRSDADRWAKLTGGEVISKEEVEHETV